MREVLLLEYLSIFFPFGQKEATEEHLSSLKVTSLSHILSFVL
jgi:hypothetical protein